MRQIDHILNKIPVSYYLLTVLVNFLIIFGYWDIPIDPDYSEFNRFMYAFYESVNTLFILVLGLLCYRLKFCSYNWLSVIGSLALSIINHFAIHTVVDITWVYSKAFSVGCLISLLLIIILLINQFPEERERIKQRHDPRRN